VAPPDENLVAIVATVVSFAIILPLLVKWWPRSRPRPSGARRALRQGEPNVTRKAPPSRQENGRGPG